jgi:MarR family 2-MHQ and catechol resistance regulon transcriptional repressor
MTAPQSHDGAEARALKLWIILSRAYRAVLEHVEADIGRHELTVAEFAILEALHHKGPQLLGEVQQRILVSSGGITYLVDRLEKRGLVERRLCPEDRRARYAALTSAGEAMMTRIFPAHASAIVHAVGGLDAQGQEEAIRLLRTLGHAAAERPPTAESKDAGAA